MAQEDDQYPKEDISFEGDIDIGDVNILNSSGTVIDPLTVTEFNEIKNASDEVKVDLVAQTVSPLTVDDNGSFAVNSVAGVGTLTTDVNDNLQIDIPGQPLDVSGATVTVDDSGNFAVSSLPSLPAGSNNIGEVNVAENQNEANVQSGTVSVGTSQTALTTQAIPDGRKVVVRADPGNGANVDVGGSQETSLDYTLEPGDAVTYQVQNVDDVSAIAASGTQSVSWTVEST